jgi:hypothetical protein
MKHISEFLDEAMREVFEERAAILEFEGGIPREKAEALAMAEAQTWAKHREELAGQP